MSKPKKVSLEDLIAGCLYGVRAGELPRRGPRKRNRARRHARRPQQAAGAARQTRLLRRAVIRSSFLEARRRGDWSPPAAAPVVSDASLALAAGISKREVRLRRQRTLKPVEVDW